MSASMASSAKIPPPPALVQPPSGVPVPVVLAPGVPLETDPPVLAAPVVAPPVVDPIEPLVPLVVDPLDPEPLEPTELVAPLDPLPLLEAALGV
jgi:hypothetical protein